MGGKTSARSNLCSSRCQEAGLDFTRDEDMPRERKERRLQSALPPAPPPHPPSKAIVTSASELTAAVHDGGITHIVAGPGTYEMDASDVCNSYTWLCVTTPNLIIEAAEPGTVVLDAKQQGRRVFYITASGAELSGLNITGGEGAVGSRFLNLLEPSSSAPMNSDTLRCF